MSEYLSYGRFEQLRNVDELDVMSIRKKSEKGCYLEVNLEYSAESHNLHNDYQLVPEKVAVFSDMV